MFNHEPKAYICPLCIFSGGAETELNKLSDIVFEDTEVIAFISPMWWPNNPGHVIIIPKIHVENLYDINDILISRIQILGKKVACGIKEVYQCDGTSLRQHNEPAGGQHVWHFHLHIFPRWEDDNLSQNREDARYVTFEEREPYALKLRGYFLRS